MADENELPVGEDSINAAEEPQVANESQTPPPEVPPAPALEVSDLDAVVEAIGKSSANPFALNKVTVDALIAAGHAQEIGGNITLVATGRLLQAV